jgi:hypothetical protein
MLYVATRQHRSGNGTGADKSLKCEFLYSRIKIAIVDIVRESTKRVAKEFYAWYEHGHVNFSHNKDA